MCSAKHNIAIQVGTPPLFVSGHRHGFYDTSRAQSKSQSARFGHRSILLPSRNWRTATCQTVPRRFLRSRCPSEQLWQPNAIWRKSERERPEINTNVVLGLKILPIKVSKVESPHGLLYWEGMGLFSKGHGPDEKPCFLVMLPRDSPGFY